MENKSDLTNPENERKTRRNKHKVRYDLLNSVGKTLRDHGFNNLGINLVAEIAGTDKNSIYRHFGSFEELLNQYIEKQDFWIKSLSSLKDIKVDDHKNFMKQILLEQYETINSNKELQQLLIWELGEFSQRTKAIAQRREELAKVILKQYESYFEDTNLDFNVIVAIMIAGIYYLILHKEHSSFYLVDCKNEKERIIIGIGWMVDIIFQPIINMKMQEQIAINALKKELVVQVISEITQLSLSKVNELKLEMMKVGSID